MGHICLSDFHLIAFSTIIPSFRWNTMVPRRTLRALDSVRQQRLSPFVGGHIFQTRLITLGRLPSTGSIHSPPLEFAVVLGKYVVAGNSISKGINHGHWIHRCRVQHRGRYIIILRRPCTLFASASAARTAMAPISFSSDSITSVRSSR